MSVDLIAADSPLGQRYRALAAEAFGLGITPEPVGFPCEQTFLIEKGTALRARVEAAREVAHCRSCNAPVWWGETAAGKRCPFDVIDGARTQQSHFATCPQAVGWSKRVHRKEAGHAG